MEFTINAVPPRATAQSVSRIGRTKDGRPFIMKDKRGQKVRDELLILLMQHAPPEPMSGPLAIKITFVFPWRKSEPKWRLKLGMAPHTTRPDGDNLIKMFLDQMGKARFYTDDATLSDIRVCKFWGDLPRMEVRLTPIGVSVDEAVNTT
ncbi:RusA family crossover junction endodeoxyribonuclease [Limnobacter sp.]|uniref:RusA family crossover junction endodeoxyribonuclease n=1 Tax=Limnobacter sp. TaxID=2003368 RepID=UPI0025BADA71|nr:RusA family crossover junction endodeoxyribonuclease [Limnobacter sp.]